jgi:hypothetical protein
VSTSICGIPQLDEVIRQPAKFCDAEQNDYEQGHAERKFNERLTVFTAEPILLPRDCGTP